jgi:Zn-dependent protease with chaperone function
MLKNKFIWLTAGMLSMGLVQANELENKFKGFLKKKLITPTLPILPTLPTAPTQPVSPAAPGVEAEKPAEHLVQALLAGTMSEAEEARIGQQIAGNLLGAAPLVRDDGLQRYVNQVGRWVALQSERPDLNWHFGVIESEDLNAFAAPGGYIFLTKGLYGVCRVPESHNGFCPWFRRSQIATLERLWLHSHAGAWERSGP